MRFSQYYIPIILGLVSSVPSIGASAQVTVGIGLSVPIAPPELPIYAQPPIPARGYLWTPGFWSYQEEGGYYWVPGTWVRPPRVGVLWTPPYWGFVGGAYSFNAGYWGPEVGFYGGVNYGFGYGGFGYGGGRWNGGNFAYNSAVNNFGNTRITNVYNERIINENASRASFNGGAGGIQAQADARQLAMARERHIAATAEQSRHMAAARENMALRASANHGHPEIAATSRPGQFRGRDVVAANDAVHGASASAPGRERGASASAPGHMARVAGEHPVHPVHPVHPAHAGEGNSAASNRAPHARRERAPGEHRAAEHRAPGPRVEHAAAPRPAHASSPRTASEHRAPAAHPAAARSAKDPAADKHH